MALSREKDALKKGKIHALDRVNGKLKLAPRTTPQHRQSLGLVRVLQIGITTDIFSSSQVDRVASRVSLSLTTPVRRDLRHFLLSSDLEAAARHTQSEALGLGPMRLRQNW
jgi:hypothetical protein